ncbi:hypothetical protein ACQJBY_042781 [Aegilops geniculata]
MAGAWTDGFLYTHSLSRWTTVRDSYHDILAGRYLDVDERIHAGTRLNIDDFEILVDNCLQETLGGEDQTEVVNLASEPDAPIPKLKIGGRFWVLADDEDEEGDEAELSPGAIKTRQPEMRFMAPLAESFMKITPGEGRKDMRVAEPRPVALGKPSSMKIKPWKGPLPKVIFRATALIRMWSLLTPTEAKERLVTGSIRWEMVAQAIFNRFGLQSCNRIDN